MGLGEKEIHFLQKFLEIIRTNPAKAEKMVKEEEKDDQDGSGAQVTELPSLRSDRGSILNKRAAEMKMAKKKNMLKRKKADKTRKKDKSFRSKKVERVKSKLEKDSKKRKLPKKGKHIAKKINNKKLKQKKKKKIKIISRTNKLKQKRKQMHQNKQKSEFLVKSETLENCTSLWSELTNIGLGAAATLKKQVVDIDLVIKVDSLAGKFHYKQ